MATAVRGFVWLFVDRACVPLLAIRHRRWCGGGVVLVVNKPKLAHVGRLRVNSETASDRSPRKPGRGLLIYLWRHKPQDNHRSPWGRSRKILARGRRLRPWGGRHREHRQEGKGSALSPRRISSWAALYYRNELALELFQTFTAHLQNLRQVHAVSNRPKCVSFNFNPDGYGFINGLARTVAP